MSCRRCTVEQEMADAREDETLDVTERVQLIQDLRSEILNDELRHTCGRKNFALRL